MPEKTNIPERNEIDNKYKWKLEDLYPDTKSWEESYESVSEKSNKYSSFSGKIAQDPETLIEFLKFNDEISIQAERLYVYANMKFHEDSRVSQSQELSNKAEMLMVKLMNDSSFATPEITSIGEEKLSSFISKKPELKEYEHYLLSLMRRQKHILSKAEEEILAKTGNFSNTAEDIFAMINDADMTFGDITDENGQKVTLTKGRYSKYMESENRDVRKAAFDTLYASYEKQKNTLATTYYSAVKKDAFYADVRKYGSSLEAALDDDNIPISVYNNLISAVHKYLPLMHRYVKIRKKILGLDELHPYDLYAPLAKDANLKITYNEAKETVLKALDVMGEKYISALKEGFESGWIDVYENKGKRGGAYSWGTYSCHPYVLLNHNDNLNSMFTVAHEMGHALHSYFTWKKQPYIYSGHKIFVAEVASTCNEALLMEYMLRTTTDKNARKYLINYFLEQFKGTFFRQAMFAEFEKTAHDMVEKGQPLTCDILCNMYHDLNKQYFGDELVIDKNLDLEWARIPHFYSAFYVYQYATGYTAAIALSSKILKEGQSAVDKYMEFLSNGNSLYSIDLLKGAGVDMTSTEPFDKAMAVFESLLNMMENEF